MSPRSFGKTDVVACIAALLLLVFLFIYPHCRLAALRDDVSALCDGIISAADAEEWEKARVIAADIDARFERDKTLLRFVLDHEDIDSAADAISSTMLMAQRCDGTETVIEAENIKSIVTYLAGIETFTLDNLF